jgi:hypothetical protein
MNNKIRAGPEVLSIIKQTDSISYIIILGNLLKEHRCGILIENIISSLNFKSNEIRLQVDGYDKTKSFQIAITDFHVTLLSFGLDVLYNDRDVKNYRFFYSLSHLSDKTHYHYNDRMIYTWQCYDKRGSELYCSNRFLRSINIVKPKFQPKPVLRNNFKYGGKIINDYIVLKCDCEKINEYQCLNSMKLPGIFFYEENGGYTFFKNNLKKGMYKKLKISNLEIRFQQVYNCYNCTNYDFKNYMSSFMFLDKRFDKRFDIELNFSIGVRCYDCSMPDWYEDLRFLEFIGCRKQSREKIIYSSI